MTYTVEYMLGDTVVCRSPPLELIQARATARSGIERHQVDFARLRDHGGALVETIGPGKS